MSKPDPVAISPDEGPLPPIYVPPKGQPGPPGQLWHLVVRAVRRGGGWAARHLPRRNDVRHPR
jgi:hypothetical protein